MKKVISLFLSLVMLLSITCGMNMSASAATSNCKVICEYLDTAQTKAMITGYKGTGDYLSVPDYLSDGAKVVAIGDYAFSDFKELKGLIIPNTVTSIGKGAFEGCSNLEFIVLPNNLGVIKERTFAYCAKLNYVYDNNYNFWPSGLKTIEKNAFAFCSSLVEFSAPNVTSIGEGAFGYCTALFSVVLPKSLEFVQLAAFGNCTGIEFVGYEGTQSQFNQILIASKNDAIKTGVKFNNKACDYCTDLYWCSSGNSIFVCCMNCGDINYDIGFKDLVGYESYIDYLVYTSIDNEFIKGTNPPYYTMFSPKTPITRAMFVTILYRMAGSPYDASNPHKTTPFSDITNKSVYYYNAACWALDLGITTEKKFRPNDLVVREQTAAFLFRYADIAGFVDDDYKKVDLTSYPDYSSVSSWAVPAMQWANLNGMITGTQQGYLNPKGSTLRIHATKILYGFGVVCNIGFGEPMSLVEVK